MIYSRKGTLNLLDNFNLDLQQPTHIFDTLDNQMEQNAQDDFEIGEIDDPAFESFSCNSNLKKENQSNFDSCKYRVSKFQAVIR